MPDVLACTADHAPTSEGRSTMEYPHLTSDGLALSKKKRAKILPPKEVLDDILRYDAKSGKLYWRTRPPKYFRDKLAQARWNDLYAGKETFSATQNGGGKCGKIFGNGYQAHRVIWKIVTGEDPNVIDHINGNPADNRWVNLRSVSVAENLRNRAMPSSNTSGCVGVRYDKTNKVWVADIYFDGERIWLCASKDKAVAIEARKAAEKKYGYHKNHGRTGAPC